MPSPTTVPSPSHVTLAGNLAVNHGGGVQNFGTFYTLGSILAGNKLPPPDRRSATNAVTSQGYNLVGDATGSSGWGTTDLKGTHTAPLNALLGPLQNNGGLTPTMLPLPGSPAVDIIPGSPLLGTDQRGLPSLVGSAGDSGAVEVQPDAATHVGVSRLPISIAQGTPINITVTAKDPYNHLAGFGGLSITDSNPSLGLGLPASYQLTPQDNGVHVFTLQTPSVGSDRLVVSTAAAAPDQPEPGDRFAHLSCPLSLSCRRRPPTSLSCGSMSCRQRSTSPPLPTWTTRTRKAPAPACGRRSPRPLPSTWPRDHQLQRGGANDYPEQQPPGHRQQPDHRRRA